MQILKLIANWIHEYTRNKSIVHSLNVSINLVDRCFASDVVRTKLPQTNESCLLQNQYWTCIIVGAFKHFDKHFSTVQKKRKKNTIVWTRLNETSFPFSANLQMRWNSITNFKIALIMLKLGDYASLVADTRKCFSLVILLTSSII